MTSDRGRWTVVVTLLSMKTIHLDPDACERASLVVEEIERLLSEGKRIVVSIAEQHELLSPQQAADRLGFSRQHVLRLINAGELEARKLPGSSDWRIPLAAALAFEERGRRADEMANGFSRSLDALGAPLE
jgi:excisionase family DNA binding protein